MGLAKAECPQNRKQQSPGTMDQVRISTISEWKFVNNLEGPARVGGA